MGSDQNIGRDTMCFVLRCLDSVDHKWKWQSQEYWNVPLHVHHRLQADQRGSLRGELRQAVFDHVHTEGVQRDGEEVLQAGREDLRRERSRGLSDRVRVRLHDQVHGEGAWRQACRGDQLWEAARRDLWGWLLLWGGGGGVPRQDPCHGCRSSWGDLRSQPTEGDLWCFSIFRITEAGLRHQALFLADMQIGDASGAATWTHETVHHSSQGDLSAHILEVPCLIF